jgi:cell division protein FtsB
VITENLIIKGLQIICSALTPIEQMEAAATAETRLMVVLTVFAVLTLIISVVLLVWVRARYRQIAELTAANEKLRQENSELRPKSV